MTRPVPVIAAERNRYLAKLIDALPEYHASLALADEAQRRVESLTAVAEVPPNLNPSTSGTISDEWIELTLDHEAHAARRERHRKLLLDVKHAAIGRANSVYAANINPMLSSLNDDLQGLLGEVAAVAEQLGDATTPKAAIANDRGPAWRRLTELADDYQLLRNAQAALMAGHTDALISARPSAGGEDHATDLYLANLDDLWPHWRTPNLGPQQINIDGTKPRYEPWPADRDQLLLWLATSEADPWVPTLPQLDALRRERQQRANPNPTKMPGIRKAPINQPLSKSTDRVIPMIRAV